MKTVLMMATVFYGVVSSVYAQDLNQEPQQKLADVKASVANQAALRAYTWTAQTEIRL